MNTFVKKLLSSTLALFFVGTNLNIASAGGSDSESSESNSTNQSTPLYLPDDIYELDKMLLGIICKIIRSSNKELNAVFRKSDVKGIYLCKKIVDKNGEVLLDLDESIESLETFMGRELTIKERLTNCIMISTVFLDVQQ